MGRSGSGKTSMRSIIFANYLARDTMRLDPTLDVENSHVRILGSLVLNLWDCGGQDAFYEHYFESQREHIFRNVELLIYVFDIQTRDLEKDFARYEGCVQAIAEMSPDAKIFALVHKMDVIPEASRDEVFAGRAKMIEARSGAVPLTCFKTSIWDETLYKAWSSIVYSLIPNIKRLETHLDEFCDVCGADEVVLFERATFLVISHATHKPHSDIHRFEKISNIIKQFKLSCSKMQSQFQGMMVGNSSFTAFVDSFTSNTYVMIILSNPLIPEGSVKLNVSIAKEHFETLIRQGSEGV